jgi:3D (Asp-Asp-Asp) domain-containing protein
MEIYIEEPPSRGKKISSILIVIGILVILGGAGFIVREIKAQSSSSFSASPYAKELAIVQGNSVLPISNPSSPPESVPTAQKVEMVITGYSSTICQTDSDPFVTASGKLVKDGVVANNLLPFGTRIRIPDIYGDKIFVVEDRMNWRKGYYHLDIWFPEYWQAKSFGVRSAYIEILEN